MAEKRWTQPKLIVLGRGTPEESVLEVCKNETMPYASEDRDSCQVKFANAHPCRGVTGS